MGNLQGGEILLLLVLAIVILGPSKLPEYAAGLARIVRNLRDMAEGAKSTLKEEMGPAFDDVQWDQLDPRQYDPRRIVREALATPSEKPRTTAEKAGMVPIETTGSGADRRDGAGTVSTSGSTGSPASRRPTPRRSSRKVHDPNLPTPFDVDAT